MDQQSLFSYLQCGKEPSRGFWSGCDEKNYVITGYDVHRILRGRVTEICLWLMGMISFPGAQTPAVLLMDLYAVVRALNGLITDSKVAEAHSMLLEPGAFSKIRGQHTVMLDKDTIAEARLKIGAIACLAGLRKASYYTRPHKRTVPLKQVPIKWQTGYIDGWEPWTK
jgi:hypothetical protein